MYSHLDVGCHGGPMTDIIPDQQFSYDSFARLDLVFGTQHKAGEALLEECRKGTIDLP
jgi:hypothetical protein